MRLYVLLFMILVWLIPFSCTNTSNHIKNDELFEGFVNPPAEARPFVRWWWNGNQITAREIERQLNVLKEAGFGGIEINPIAMPEEAKDIGGKSLKWLSREWNELLVLAANEAKNRGMISDLIVGSGWPFGGEFLEKDELIQRVITNRVEYSRGNVIKESFESLLSKALTTQNHKEMLSADSNEILFVSLVPAQVNNFEFVRDITLKFKENGRLDLTVKEEKVELIYGILQKGHRQVMHGALGASGPVMNHYEKEVTLAYLNRLSKISADTGKKLEEIIRALFCDSIELAGANWTDNFESTFFLTYGYSLKPYLPFIFYDPDNGYLADNYSEKFYDTIRRVRYDYNRLLVEVFLNNFTRTFQDFCTKNNVKCRYQAYGTPFLMGIIEGNMISDMPEGNNWLNRGDMDDRVWNLCASSGGHLSGKSTISCEAMTNLRGVFKTSLEEIKKHDDMNFLTGMNHTILHGYNYSPVEAGFPGWIRYGTYFSEQNTWWPYLSKWIDYNSRLSYVFQQSQPVKNIAILGPTGDIWSNKGLNRFHYCREPWYLFRLWESISQFGNSCDYINEGIIQKGVKENAGLQYGKMVYQTIVLCNVESLEVETAKSLQEFVINGGKIIVLNKKPSRSLSFKNASSNDELVKSTFEELTKEFPDQVLFANTPSTESELLPFIEDTFSKLEIKGDVSITKPDNSLYQIHLTEGDKDIYFFVNSSENKTIEVETKFPIWDKIPWVWNPEDGTRYIFPIEENENELNIELQPLQSFLLVFEPDMIKTPNEDIPQQVNQNRSNTIHGPWLVNFKRVDGKSFRRSFDKLADFGSSEDNQLNTFAGTITYSTIFKSPKQPLYLEIENVNNGITEVYINDKQIGINWYGKARFLLNDKIIKEGDNTLDIKHTTILLNYCSSLEDNPIAMRWTQKNEKLSLGLEGDVKIIY